MSKGKSSRRTKQSGAGSLLRQVAALPYRRSAEGQLEVLLVTTKFTRRFIIPKGWPAEGRKDAKSAAKEAEQEAGVLGDVEESPFARYSYLKKIEHEYVSVSVDVFALKVTGQIDEWRERDCRFTRWLSADEAALLTDEPELIPLIRSFAQSKRRIARIPK